MDANITPAPAPEPQPLTPADLEYMASVLVPEFARAEAKVAEAEARGDHDEAKRIRFGIWRAKLLVGDLRDALAAAMRAAGLPVPSDD